MTKTKPRKEPTAQEQRRYERRRGVVEAVQRGEAVAVVARVFGVAVRSVFDWLSWYRRGEAQGPHRGVFPPDRRFQAATRVPDGALRERP